LPRKCISLTWCYAESNNLTAESLLMTALDDDWSIDDDKSVGDKNIEDDICLGNNRKRANDKNKKSGLFYHNIFIAG